MLINSNKLRAMQKVTTVIINIVFDFGFIKKLVKMHFDLIFKNFFKTNFLSVYRSAYKLC